VVDVHVWTDGPTPTALLAGMFSYDTALGADLPMGRITRWWCFELNANNHSQRRALANALAINAIERDGRLPITTSANCLQPDGQNKQRLGSRVVVPETSPMSGCNRQAM